MLKNIVKFEHIVEGKLGQFLIDCDTPLAAAKEMGLKFLMYLGQIEEQAKAQQEAQNAQASPPPESQQDESVKEVKNEEAVS